MLEIRFHNSTLCISVLFLVGVVVLLSLDNSGVGLLCLLFSCLHECGHLCAFAAYGSIPSKMVIGLGGLRIEHSAQTLSYRQSLVVSLAGPAVNAVCTLVCALAGQWVAAWTAALLGGMQLLPVRSLDGGQALYCVLCLWYSPGSAATVVRWFSAVSITLLVVCAIVLAAAYQNFWMILVVCYLFIGFFSNSS